MENEGKLILTKFLRPMLDGFLVNIMRNIDIGTFLMAIPIHKSSNSDRDEGIFIKWFLVFSHIYQND